MFDIGWTELLLIGVVSLIVIGPKDLPEMFRQLGRVTAKLRQMAREFQRAMEQAAKESGAADLARDVNAIANPKNLGVDAVKAAADKFEKWDPIKNAAKPSGPVRPSGVVTPAAPLTPPPMPAAPAAAAATTATAAVEAAATESAPAAAHGPATKALYDRKAAREAVLRESAAKLRAIDEGAEAAAAAEPAPAPRRKTAARKAKPSATPPATDETP